MRILVNEKVEKVGSIAYNKNVFTVSVGNGWRASAEEFDEISRTISREVDLDIPLLLGFQEWSTEERTYVAILEQAYRIARYFGSKLEGGRLSG